MFSERNSGRSIALLTVLALVVLLVAPLVVNVHAATSIVFDAKSAATPCTTGPCAVTLSWSHVVGSGANGILIVSVWESVAPGNTLKTVSNIMYGTLALSSIGSHVDTAGSSELEMWGVLNPPAGSHTITVTLAGADDGLFAGSVSYFNVGGSHAFLGADGPPSPPAWPLVIVNANSGDLVVDAVVMAIETDHLAFTNSPVSPQTERWSSTGAIPDVEDVFMGGSDLPASSPVWMMWTSTPEMDFWIQVAVALTPFVPIPEYPLGLPLLAVFMIVGYGLIRRRTKVR